MSTIVIILSDYQSGETLTTRLHFDQSTKFIVAEELQREFSQSTVAELVEFDAPVHARRFARAA